MMKRGKISKNSTWKKNFYLSILSELEKTTNLSKIQNGLQISKQNLNYYLRQMKKEGLIKNPSRGFWAVVKSSKNSTKYGSNLPKDFVRGHAYIINLTPKQFPENWSNRISILKQKNINFKLVGAKETTPRIKCLGRKVWLCNNHLRIYLKKEESFYGENAIESRKKAFWEVYKILDCLENKLGFSLRPFDFQWKKEHYALIKNDLAIEHNKKGIILKVKDENNQEWLLVDDSMGMGGELENVGKKALETNIPMQKWWNENKSDKFITSSPKFLHNKFKEIERINLEQIKKIEELSKRNLEMSLVLEQVTNNLIKTTNYFNERFNSL